MVYETDFYTVRRPYSRPTFTSYSVTGPRVGISTWKVKPSIRTSVLMAELDRIYHRPRPHLGYAPLEDFLNSRPLVDFDDETKHIRADCDKLMRRIYTSVPHPRHSAPLQILPYYGSHYTYDPTPLKERSYNSMVHDILSMSYYSEPTARTIGRGHLACVTYAGGRGYPRRKHLYSDENRDIGDEIRTRSYYNNNYNKAYVDAMSLPTGFASYLLRIKPPEKNETLTNLDKMHIIALAEERKKNKKNKKEDETLDQTKPKLVNGTASANEKDSFRPSKTPKLSWPNEDTKSEIPATETLKEKSAPEIENNLTSKANGIVDTVTSKEPDPVLPPIESVKSEKKSKPRKSLSKVSSLSDSTATELKEEKPNAEEKPIVATNQDNEIVTKEKSSVSKFGELPHLKESKEPQSITNESMDLEVKTEPDVKEPSRPETVQPAEEIISELKSEPAPIEDLAIVEQPKETEPISIKDLREAEPILVEEPKEAEPVSVEETLKREPSESTEQPENLKEESKTQEANETSELPKVTEHSVDSSIHEETLSQSEACIIPDPVKEPNENEVLPITEKEETVKEEAPFDAFVHEEIKSSLPPESAECEKLTDDLKPEATSEEVTKEDTEKTYPKESSIPNKLTENEEVRRESLKEEPADPEPVNRENVIEDVTDFHQTDTVKENETEPLIEEPQSPCDNPEKLEEKNHNEITEVLSDVPEES